MGGGFDCIGHVIDETLRVRVLVGSSIGVRSDRIKGGRA
jgi:hypothetical protein